MFVFFRDKLVISHAKRDFINITIMKQFLSFSSILRIMVVMLSCPMTLVLVHFWLKTNNKFITPFVK